MSAERLTPMQELIKEFERIQKEDCKSLVETVFFNGVLAVIEGRFLEIEKQCHESQQSEKEKELYEALSDLMIEVNNDWVTVETANKVEKTLEKYKPKG